jgi:hypothetical protein
MSWMDHGLGRLVIPDERDSEFPVLRQRPAVLPKESRDALARGWRYWNAPNPLDQGSMPACVGFAWVHWLIAGPLAQRDFTEQNAITIYRMAQTLDEWPGVNYEGTSVRGGVKALRNLGVVKEYRWSSTLEQTVYAVLAEGPVVVGLDWFAGMDEPAGNVMRAKGRFLGGHAFMLIGASEQRRMFRILNSWGSGWEDNGRAWLPFEDFAWLLGRRGEACLATEQRRPQA